MALINCPECGNAVSDRAVSCIHCGFPISAYINAEPQPIEDNFTPYTPRRSTQAPKHVQKAPQSRTTTRAQLQRAKKKKQKKLVSKVGAALITILIIVATIGITKEIKNIKEHNVNSLGDLTGKTASSQNISKNTNTTQKPIFQNSAKEEDKNSSKINAGYELLTTAQFGDINFARYYIHDIDNNGEDEIIIIAGTCEADATLIVYKYQNGTYVQAGSTSGGHCSLCDNSKDGGIIIHYGSQGYESINSLNLTNETIQIEQIIPERQVYENYTELNYCVPITCYAISDTRPFGGSKSSSITSTPESISEKTIDSSSNNLQGNNTSKAKKNIDVNLSIIGSSAKEFLQKVKLSGSYYYSNWDNTFFDDGKEIYSLRLDGSEENYYIQNCYGTLTARGDTIIAYSESAFQVTDIKNVYQLLNFMSGEYVELLNYDPEILQYEGDSMIYLKWTTNNAIFVISTLGWDVLAGEWTWKSCSPWSFCVFEK